MTAQLTPEQVAQVQAQADPQPETLPAPATQTAKWIGLACKSQAKGARHRTRCNLETTAAMVKGIESEMLQGAHSHQDIDTWRKSAVALFAAPLSLTTGESLTAKKLQNEWLPIHYLVSLLPEESQRRATMVNWESLRVLARWAIHVANEPLFSPHEIYEESWRIQDGCETKLIELVSALSRVPMDRTKLGKEMDRIERELSGASEPVPTPRDDQKTLNRFFEGVADRVAKMKMDGAELYKQLIHRKLISPPDFDGINLSTMTTQQAEQLADAIGATGNVGAAAALVSRLRPYLMAAAKPSGPVSASVDALGGMSREIRKSA